MNRMFSILISLALLAIVAITPAYAGGDKNHGDAGQGGTEQGEAGSGTSPGDNAQGNQAP